MSETMTQIEDFLKDKNVSKFFGYTEVDGVPYILEIGEMTNLQRYSFAALLLKSSDIQLTNSLKKDNPEQ